DEESFPSKCCGGLLAPDAQKIIAEMGLCAGRDILSGPQLFAVHAIDMEKNIERFYQRFYINIDRERFDRWLFSLVPSSVDVIHGALFKGFIRKEDHFEITSKKGDESIICRARIIVGADGATSLVRRLAFGDKSKIRSYVSIQEWFHTENPTPYYAALFDRGVTDFYSWIIPKEDRILLGSAIPVTGKEAQRRFEALKEKVSRYGYKTGKVIRREGTLILRPRTSDILTSSHNVALIGEAGGFISPSSAEGFSYAFRSAIALAESLRENFGKWEHLYRKKTSHLKMNIALKNIKSPAMYNPLLRRIIMGSGIQSIDTQLSN
ncbi:MAG TPA: FAD-binding protein, partial [Spirochaetota bacterium]